VVGGGDVRWIEVDQSGDGIARDEDVRDEYLTRRGAGATCDRAMKKAPG
jgi:hypothetical protein